MDLARSWTVGVAVTLLTLVGLSAVGADSRMHLVMLVSSFVGVAAAALVHPAPHRDRVARQLLAALPAAFAVPLLGGVAMHRVDAAMTAGAWALVIGQSLLAAVLAVAVVRLLRRPNARSHA